MSTDYDDGALFAVTSARGCLFGIKPEGTKPYNGVLTDVPHQIQVQSWLGFSNPLTSNPRRRRGRVEAKRPARNPGRLRA